MTNIKFEKEYVEEWTLPRKEKSVSGYSYFGVVDNVGGVSLNRKIVVLGYNHNIQSSFGVTSEVQQKIRNWITIKSKKIFDETIR